MQLSLWELSTFTMSDGGELITIVLSEPRDVKINEVLEVVDRANCIFEGRISHEYAISSLGYQVIQAVISSEVHSGEDYASIGRAMTDVKAIKKNLNDWEWGELSKRVRPMLAGEDQV